MIIALQPVAWTDECSDNIVFLRERVCVCVSVTDPGTRLAGSKPLFSCHWGTGAQSHGLAVQWVLGTHTPVLMLAH